MGVWIVYFCRRVLQSLNGENKQRRKHHAFLFLFTELSGACNSQKQTFMKKLFSISMSIMACALLCTSCDESSKELVLSNSSVNLHYEESKYVYVVGENGTAMWESGNEFVASVSNGTITGNHVGETFVSANVNGKTAICQVEVTPQYYTYVEPIMQWGISPSELKNIKGTPDQTLSSGTLAYYQDMNKGIIEMYTFKNNQLTSCGVMLNTKNSDVGRFLVERYQAISEKDGVFVLINAMSLDEATLGVGFQVASSSSGSYFLVTYIPWNNSSNSPAKKMPQFNVNKSSEIDEIAAMLL